MTLDVDDLQPAGPVETSAGDATPFADRLLGAVLGAQEVQAVYLGDRLGWYAALAEAESLSPPELARLTGSVARYAQEWLEHQAVSGYVEVAQEEDDPSRRRYRLPAEHAEALADPDGLGYLAPLARLVAGVGLHLDRTARAYREGGGVSWAELGVDAREAQADANRPFFLSALVQELLPAVPDLHERLRAGARVADVGCGEGWSSVGLALGYPASTVDGFDVDQPSVAAARRHVAEAGVADRVSVHESAVGAAHGPFDVVFLFECLHDMPDPVGVLTAVREAAAPDAQVVVVDERTDARFSAPADELQRLFYGYSIACCLPDSLAHEPSVGTGTVIRPSTLEHYAHEAGFPRVEVLPVEHEVFRFYRLLMPDAGVAPDAEAGGLLAPRPRPAS